MLPESKDSWWFRIPIVIQTYAGLQLRTLMPGFVAVWKPPENILSAKIHIRIIFSVAPCSATHSIQRFI